VSIRKVLLITFHYPPQPAIGGLRPRALAKYLPEYGWQAIVLTPRLPDAKRQGAQFIETGYRDVLQDLKGKFGLNPRQALHQQWRLPLSTKRDTKLFHTRAIDWLKPWLAYPDTAKGWIPLASDAIAEFAKREQVDAILTTSPPESCHIIGARAKKLLGCPWIADFRDLWTQNLAQSKHGSLKLRVRLEKKTLAAADALVTVSDPWRDRLAERYAAKPIYTITNGFDPDDFQNRPQQLTEHFSITYAGQLYQGKRDPGPLFEVLAELIGEQALPPDQIRVRFYGPPEPWLPELIARYGLQKVVELNKIVGRDEALQREMESQILLLLGWSDPKETGQHSGKLFEYLGAGRPILAVGGGRGVLTDVLEETKAGVHALSKTQLRESVLAMYREFKDSGRVRYHADSEAVEQHSHSQMARKFSDVLDVITGLRNSPASPCVPALSVCQDNDGIPPEFPRR
jgi:glycosyltransferase involved in cell wall biosynthesis